MDKNPEIYDSEGELDQVIAEILKKSFMVIQLPNTIWQHIQHIMENITGDREASESRVQ
jgi:hypothetical protein